MFFAPFLESFSDHFLTDFGTFLGQILGSFLTDFCMISGRILDNFGIVLGTKTSESCMYLFIFYYRRRQCRARAPSPVVFVNYVNFSEIFVEIL